MTPQVVIVAMTVTGSLVAARTSCAQPVPVPLPAAIDVREDTAIGSRPGTLRLDAGGLAFIAGEARRSRSWAYEEIRQLRFESSRLLVVETYASRGWRGFGRSRTFEYRAGQPIPPDWVAFALARIPRPVVTAIVPPRPTPAGYAIAVHHEGTDTAGMLRLYADGLAFETSRDGYARFWRFADLDSVLRQDRYRLSVAVFEGTRERIRPFLFTLKDDLPAGFYDDLWQQINRRGLTTPAAGDRPH